jgi:hypothetical protein
MRKTRRTVGVDRARKGTAEPWALIGQGRGQQRRGLLAGKANIGLLTNGIVARLGCS